MKRRKSLTVFAGLMLSMALQSRADAQGVHVHHHDHVVRDQYGRVVGNYHHDVVHPNSSYVVTSQNAGHGNYYVYNGSSYYYPTPHGGHTVTAHRPVQPVPLQFGGFSHVDELATTLETLMNDLCLDLHYNYRHNSGFSETYAEAYQILDTARYIHAAEHDNDRQTIASRLNGMDAEFHHIQDDVRGWSRVHRQQVGHLGIITKMNQIEATIHHLMEDVGVHGNAAQQAPPPGGLQQQAPPPGGLLQQAPPQ